MNLKKFQSDFAINVYLTYKMGGKIRQTPDLHYVYVESTSYISPVLTQRFGLNLKSQDKSGHLIYD